MAALVLRIYDFLSVRRRLCLALLLVLTVLLAAMASRQHYREDIADFLPLDSRYGLAMKVYQEIAGAGRIVAIVAHADTCAAQSPDVLTAAVDAFADAVRQRDTMGIAATMVAQTDMEQIAATARFVYSHAPYFLTGADYARMDSLMATPGYVEQQMATARQMLTMPMTATMAQGLACDPLNLFQPVMERLARLQPSASYEDYDGYIFAPDMSFAIVLLQSPFGGSETSGNARLLRFLEDCAASAQTDGVSIRFAGGPVIAVGNAARIRSDSLLALSLAALLIVAMLVRAFRRVGHLLLIAASIAWGWLFAMGVMAVARESVSLIVIGISSVIVGIAVNYPLHLLAHLRHTTSMRQALRETASPLIVGNITTVGAFAALLPLQSVALRDLGLFSSLLLAGTILFVLVFLPQLCRHEPTPQEEHHTGTTPTTPTATGRRDALPAIVAQGRRGALPAVVALLTVVFGCLSIRTSFDTDISNINYMTAEQRRDMKLLAQFAAPHAAPDDRPAVYVVSSGSSFDEALARPASVSRRLQQLVSTGRAGATGGCHDFLCPPDEQRQRLARWSDFVHRHNAMLQERLASAARSEGFADDAFDGFTALLHDDMTPQRMAFFAPLTTTVFASSLATTDNQCHVVDVIATDAPPEQIASADSCFAFSVEGMNRALASNLSADFNYIGWACALIVFLFLWASMGSVELALLSFLPMAVSWVWILGLMALLDIHFNLVNIILATFIFGQGDDYTIFMTEGCQYEYAYRRRILSSYRQGIVLSALIMFTGIGVLIFARHPALRSLAQVTIVGMGSVVLMAWLLPPLAFRWLVARPGGWRQQPLSLSLLWRKWRGGKGDNLRQLVYDRYRYKGLHITRSVGRSLRRHATLAAASETAPVAVVNSGYGEVALLLALQQRQRLVYALEQEEEKQAVARHSADGMATNIVFMDYRSPAQIARLQAQHPNLQIIRL